MVVPEPASYHMIEVKKDPEGPGRSARVILDV